MPACPRGVPRGAAASTALACPHFLDGGRATAPFKKFTAAPGSAKNMIDPPDADVFCSKGGRWVGRGGAGPFAVCIRGQTTSLNLKLAS